MSTFDQKKQNEENTKKSKEIWETLSKIDVSDHVEKKGNLTYLSWSWAWSVMKENYPQFRVVWWHGVDPEEDMRIYDDGTCSVSCRVYIDGVSEYMWLPVMDYKNKAIVNPDSRSISDAKMRCMVKCFALHGLGHYIYAGEDLPSHREENVEKKIVAPVKVTKLTPAAELPHPEYDTEEVSLSGVTTTYEVFLDDCESLSELKKFWIANEKELSKLEIDQPKTYKIILDSFTETKENITGKGK